MSKRRAGNDGSHRDEAVRASRIDPIGHAFNVNRNVAKWEKQVRDRLQRIGGDILVAHLTGEVVQPKDMLVPPGALDVNNYLRHGPIFNEATQSQQQLQQIDRIEARLEKKNNKLLRNSGKLFEGEQQRRTLLDARPDPEAYDLQGVQGQDDYQTDCTAQQRLITAKSREISDRIMGMQSLNRKITKYKIKIISHKAHSGDEEPQDLRESAYFKMILKTCTSAQGAGNATPLAQKPQAFAAWASIIQQQALHEARETKAKQLLADNTMDSLQMQVHSLKDRKTTHGVMNHILHTWRPVPKRKATCIVQNFQAGRINSDGEGEAGLAPGQSYWEYIHRLDAERQYVASIVTDDQSVKDNIEHATSESSMLNILCEAHYADHPRVETIKAIIREVDQQEIQYSEACQRFLDEEVKWQAMRTTTPKHDDVNFGQEDTRQDNRKCFNCGERGHISHECPKPDKRLLRDKSGRGRDADRGKGGGGKGKAKGRGDEQKQGNNNCRFQLCLDPDCRKQHTRGQHQPDATALKKRQDGFQQRKSQRTGKERDATSERAGGGGAGSQQPAETYATFDEDDYDYMTRDVSDDPEPTVEQHQPTSQTTALQRLRSMPVQWTQRPPTVFGSRQWMQEQATQGNGENNERESPTSTTESMHCAIEEQPELLMLAASQRGNSICLDGGASRSTSNCATDFLAMTNARGCVNTVSGTTLVQKGTIIYVVRATYKGVGTYLTLIMPNKNKVKALDGDTTTRLLGEFDLASMGFRDKGTQEDDRSLWEHTDGYQIYAEFQNRIKMLPCEQVDNRSKKLDAKLRKQFIAIANAGGGFMIDPRHALELEPPQPVNVVTRRGGGHDVPAAIITGNSSQASPASQVGGERVDELIGDDKSTVDEDADEDMDDTGTLEVHVTPAAVNDTENDAKDYTDAAWDEQRQHEATEEPGDKSTSESTITKKVHFDKPTTTDRDKDKLKSATKQRTSGTVAKKWVTTFQLLRRMLAPWKRISLTVFGAPGYVTLTKLELNTYFPKRCMKLGPRGIKAFFVGKPDLMSPTLWLAVEGKKWKVIRVSWTQWRPLEDDYITDVRDEIVFPEGRHEDIEIVHGEHEMRPPTDDAEDSATTAVPAGRPRGWTKECGLTYAQFRQAQEIEAGMSSDEDDATVMTAPTQEAVHGQDHLLNTIDYNVDAMRNAATRNSMIIATRGQAAEPTRLDMIDDLYATTECWAEHVAQQIKGARQYVKVSEQLTDRQRMQLPIPRNPVEVLLAADWAELCLATQREVSGFKENAVFIVKRKCDEYPVKLTRLIELWSRKFKNGKFERCKFRAALDGRFQVPGIDCRQKVFWPTPASAVLKLIMAWAATTMRRAQEQGKPDGTGKARSSDLSTFFLQSPVDDEYGGHSVTIPGSFVLAEGNIDEWAEERARLIGLRDGPDGKTRLREEVRMWSRKRRNEYYQSQQMIYGDRAASARSGERLTAWMKSQGYTQSTVDPCFFFLLPKSVSPQTAAAMTEEINQHLDQATHDGSESGESSQRQARRARGLKELVKPPITEVHKVAIHVDDLVHVGSEEDMTNFETNLKKAFKVGEMGECTSFNGMRVQQKWKECTVTVTQPNLLEKLETEHGHYWKDAKTPTTPLPPGVKLVERATDDEFAEAKDLPFASIVSTLAYGARMTMLQIGLAVALLSRHMAKHSREHFQLLVQCAHYAYVTRNVGITYCGYGNTHDDQLSATADASFGDRSVYAHYLKMNGGAIDHSIASNKTAVLSTTEAELSSAARCARGIMGHRNLMEEMPIPHRQDGATPMEGDCGPCVTICNNPGALSDATKHMKRYAMYARELVCHHKLAYTWTPTRFLQSDVGTKPLTALLHNQHLAELNGTAQAMAWQRYKFQLTPHKPYEAMLVCDEQRQRRKESGATASRPNGSEVAQKRKIDQANYGSASIIGGGKRARTNGEAQNQIANDSEPDQVNFVNFANLGKKEKSLLQAQILGFMSNAKMIILQDCTRGFEYPGGIQNHSFLAKLRAGFPKKTQKNLHNDDEETERKYEPCEHLCVDAFELSIRTIHGGRYVYVFTDAKRSKKRWAMLARAKAHYPRVLTRLLGKVRALGWEVKCLRTDGAGEMVGEPARQVMDQHCIALEESSPHRPEENGTSERAVRAITEKARALMLNAPHLPASCGGLAVLHASALLEFQPFQINAE